MNTKMIEFKFKEKGQRINWEDLPVIYQCLSDRRAFDITITYLWRLYQMTEIRWNYKDDLQGHHITGNISKDMTIE